MTRTLLALFFLAAALQARAEEVVAGAWHFHNSFWMQNAAAYNRT